MYYLGRSLRQIQFRGSRFTVQGFEDIEVWRLTAVIGEIVI